jgi:hypothetical protein
MSLMIEENIMHEIITSIIKDLHLDINEGQEPHIERKTWLMIEVMEELRSDPLAIATNSWNERQIILSHIMDAGLIPEIRDPLFQRAEHALSKAGV